MTSRLSMAVFKVINGIPLPGYQWRSSMAVPGYQWRSSIWLQRWRLNYRPRYNYIDWSSLARIPINNNSHAINVWMEKRSNPRQNIQKLSLNLLVRIFKSFLTILVICDHLNFTFLAFVDGN